MVEMKIYLAGPYGFSEGGRHFYYEKLIPLIQQMGLEFIDPWQLTPPEKIEKIVSMKYGTEKREAWQHLNREIGAQNERAITEADGMIAILDGPDVDSGTAAEIGYAYAKGKKIIGYRGDFRLSSDNEGSLVNIQVEYFIWRSGGIIVRSLEALRNELRKGF